MGIIMNKSKGSSNFGASSKIQWEPRTIQTSAKGKANLKVHVLKLANSFKAL